jgi:hypothetical protein
MTATLVIVLTACILLVCFAFFAARRALVGFEPGSLQSAIQSLDVQAFRNLVDPDEDAFLRTRLPRAQYRSIKRERTRAALSYTRELSRASLQFAKYGDAIRRSPDPAAAAVGRQIAASAISLRLAALEGTVRLTVSTVFPSLDSRALRFLADRYDHASTLFQHHQALAPRADVA